MDKAYSPHILLLRTLLILWVAILWAAPTEAQAIDPEGRLVREVRFTGLVSTPQQLVSNAVRTEAGQPYRGQTIKQDIVRLTFLGKFETVEAKIEDNGDGSIDVIFKVVEQPALLALRFDGGNRFEEEELRTQVLLTPGDPIDRALIDRGAKAIQIAYEEKGHFAATVTYDEKALKDNRELVYKIVEGPRVRVMELRYEGNTVFDNDTLGSQTISDVYWWPFIAGFMDRTKLDQDVASIRDYYRGRGYLDAQVGRRIELAPKQNRAVVTFLIDEGKQHTVGGVSVRFSQAGVATDDQLMSENQIRYIMKLVRGGVYSDERLEASREAVRMWYGEIGFINTQVQIEPVFDSNKAVVDVIVQIEEGTGPTMVGDVPIIGLTRTDQKVLLRRVRGLEPGRPVNLRGLEQTRDLVRQSTWFNNGTITPLGSPDDPVRDFLIEASERNTGTFSIGAGLSSDSGVFGAISLEQRNFDITDWPESFDEFIAQRAFLGAGQTFNLTLAPGNENSTYAIGLREPYVMETDYFLDIGLRAFQSEREDFDEGRITFRTGIGRRLGDAWTGSARLRLEQVEINEIAANAPVDVFAVSGESSVTAIGFSLLRSTTDSNISPSQGSRVSISYDQIGALGGDYDFSRIALAYDQFWTLDQDFLGRRTILSLKVDTGYIPQDTADVPLFERFYSGGRDFRGFAFRGVGPRGIRNDTLLVGNDPIGGRFELITRAQYEIPVYKRTLRWAFFTDQGTVQEGFGVDDWRVAVGTGIRLNLPFFGQAPIAVDLGVPLVEVDGDDTQIISFSIDLPFN